MSQCGGQNTAVSVLERIRDVGDRQWQPDRADSGPPVATGETTVYEWDYRNRLTKIIEKDATGAVLKTVDYTYDPLNRRLAKEI